MSWASNRVLLLTGVETRYEPVAEAAGSSSAAPPAKAPAVPAKPPSPVSSAEPAKGSAAQHTDYNPLHTSEQCYCDLMVEQSNIMFFFWSATAQKTK